MPDLQSLEDRVLYSASPIPVELFGDAPVVDVDLQQLDQQLDFLTEAVEQLQYDDAADAASLQLDTDEFLPGFAFEGDLEPLVDQRLELVVIDGAVGGIQALYDDILQNYGSDRIQIHLIDPSTDGVKEISRLLEDANSRGESYSAVHVVSHGAAGEVRLGNVTLDESNLSSYSLDIISWADGLSSDADILFYGCDLSSNRSGEYLADSISLLSGADVATSDDITGHASQGGDWDLEYTAGIVESDVVFSSSLTESWNYSLATTLGDGAGTSHKSIGLDFNGNQTVVSSTEDSGDWEIRVSRFSQADPTVPLTMFDGNDFEEIQVNDNSSPSGGDHQHAVVGSAANGNFIVAWEWTNDANTESRIYAKLFDAQGNVLKGQFQVDEAGTDGNNVTVAMNQAGEFVIGWQRPHDASHSHMRVVEFDAAGDVVDASYDEHIETGYENVVVSINNLGHIAMAYSVSDNEFGARVLNNGTLSDEFTFTSNGASGFDELAIDINDEAVVGVAFVAEVGPFGAEVKDVYSVLLQYDDVDDSLVNISPTTEVTGGAGGISIDAFNHTGLDAGLEFSPSIAVENGVLSGLETDTTFHVTWHGHGSWQSNLDAGTVVDAGTPVTLASDFPGSNVVADNGVFISTTTYVSDGSSSMLPEASLQDELSDFDSDAKHTSVNLFGDRLAKAVVFETESGEASIVGVNQTPDALDSEQRGLENHGVRFEASSFGYSDFENTPLHSIRIETLPAIGDLTLFGTSISQANIDANGGVVVAASSIPDLRWNPPAELSGDNAGDFEFSVSDGENWSAPATMQMGLSAEDRLWVSTVGDTSATTGIPGDGTGTLQFGSTNLMFGDDTAGYWSEQFSPDGVSVDAVHYVSQGMEIGGTNPISLNQGDILFSVKSDGPVVTGPVGPAVVTTLPSETGTPIAVGTGDIIRFRPTSSDYSTGDYAIIASLEQMYVIPPVNYELNAFSVVEQDSIVGDRALQAGDILFSDSNNGNDVMLLELDEPGILSTGTISLLIDGDQVGIQNDISGLDFVAAKTTAGGIVLESGSILASVDAAELVGSNDELAVEAHDIFSLDVSSVTTSSSAFAVASTFFDGDDVGGDAALTDSAIDAVSLLGNPDPAVAFDVEPAFVALVENEIHRFTAADFVTDATANNLTSVTITSLPDPALGVLLLRNVEVVVDQVIDAADLDYLVYKPTFNEHFPFDSFDYRAASDSEILAEASISLSVSAVADDVLIGSGTGVDADLATELGVNVGTAGEQNEHQVARLKNGETVIVWRSVTGANEQIMLRRFSSDLVPIGGDVVVVDSAINGMKTTPSVTGLESGGFLVTATVDSGANSDIWAARYDSLGQQVDLLTGQTSATAPEVLLNGSANLFGSDIAQLQDDGFVVVYVDDSTGSDMIHASVSYADFKTDIRISDSLPAVNFSDATVEPLKDGGFVAAWKSNSTFGAKSIIVQHFDANGIASSIKTTLGASGNVDSPPSVTVLDNNQVVVVWSEATPSNAAGENRVVGVVLDSDGSIVPPGEVTIAHNDSTNVNPNVVAIGDGGFVVAVEDLEIDSSPRNIAVHRFDSEFAKLGPEQLISDGNASTLSSPQLEYSPDTGTFVAVWSKDSGATGDDLFANSFRLNSVADQGNRVPLDLTAETVSGVSDALVNVELVLETGVRVFATETATGDQVELFGPTVNLNHVDIDSVEIELPLGVLESDYQLQVTTNDGAPVTSTHEMSVTLNPIQKTLSGTIYNDENADGLIGGESGFEAVRVLLYNDVGGVRTEVSSTFTDGAGDYEFAGLNAGIYFIVADSTTIGSGLVTDVADEDKVWAEQTYGGDGSIRAGLDSLERSAGFMRGGRYGRRSDDTSTLELSEHVIRRTIAASDLVSENADFGFSFNVVTNVEDSFDAGNPLSRTDQGSLRQFINNANYVDGPNQMRFVPAVAPNESSDADNDTATGDSWWSINVVDELQAITSSDTILDGQAWQNGVTGLVERDYNAFTVRDSFVGPVGANDVAFEQTDAPELELIGSASIEHGFRVFADVDNQNVSNVEINNFAIQGFGDGSNEGGIYINGDDTNVPVTLTNVKIQDNVIGTGPNSTAYIARAETFRGVLIENASDGLVSNNVIVGNTSSGIRVFGSPQASGWSFVDNEIAHNGLLFGNADGIDASNANNFVIRRNAIHGNHGMGIDNQSGEATTGNWIVEDNSIFDNGEGAGTQGSGIRLSSDGSVVRFNRISENQFAGVSVTGYFDAGAQVFVPAKNNLISQNSFQANGTIEIDLVIDAFGGISASNYDANNDNTIVAAEATGTLAFQFSAIASSITDDGIITPDEVSAYFGTIQNVGGGVNFNDGSSNSNVANDGLDYVDVVSAEFLLGNLELEFEILNSNTNRIELYTTLPGDTDPNSEALQFFKSIDVSAMTDQGSGSYSVTLPQSDFPAGVARGTPIVAVAFDTNGNTSEFGGSATPVVTNVSPTASASTKQTNEEQSVSFVLGDFGFSDPESDPVAEVIVGSLPPLAEGQLYLDGTLVVANQRIAAGLISDLEFVPSNNYFGNATFQFAVSDGTSDSNNAPMTVEVLNVNDAPTGQDQTVPINEDQIVSFDAASFSFSDGADNGADSFAGVRIVGFAGGTLTINSGAVTAGQLLNVTEVAELRFQPDANTNGNGIATIDFRVVDSAGSNNEDATTRTLTYEVAPVPDAPTGQSQTVSITEDEIVSFDAASFNFSDSIDSDADSFAGVRIVGFTGGTLTINSGAVGAGQLLNVTEVAELRFQPDANTNGSGVATIDFRVVDSAGSNNEDTTTRTLTYDVAAVPDAPTGQSQTVSINEDEIVSFDAASFDFSDAIDSDADSFAGVRIVGFTGGTLTINSGAVTAGQLLNVTEVAELRFQPLANTNGSGISSIDFRVVDSAVADNEDTTTRTLTYDVAPVPDAPTGQSQTVSINEDEIVSFDAASFDFSDSIDSDADSFAGVRIVGFTGGTLTINSGAVGAGQMLNVTEVAELRFQPLADTNGSGISSIDFRVVDSAVADNEDTMTRTLTYDVAPVPDAPTGQSQTVSINEDEVVSFDSTSFNFSDSIDSDADSFAGVRIVGFTGGTLTINSGAVGAGQMLNVTEVAELRFQPLANTNGSGIASIDFQVVDSAVADNEDTTTRTLTYDVAPVPDAPTGQSQMVSINEDEIVSFDSTSFNFSDAIDSDADSFAGVRIVGFTGGTLTINSGAVAAGQLLDTTEVAELRFQPLADSNGNGIATIDFRVVDSGATNDEDTTTRTLTYDVVPVSDAPVGTNATIAIAEDSSLGFSAATFGFSDPIDGNADSFAGVRIVSFSGSGTLTTDAGIVAPPQIVNLAQLSQLTYAPANGESGAALASIVFRVIDSGLANNEDTTDRTLTINVGSVSDAPTGVSRTVSINEEEVVSFTAASFGFSDSIDDPADQFAGVRIEGFSGSGRLQLGSDDVTNGQLILASELPNLRFQPGADDFGLGISAIQFRVVDDGSAGNNEDAALRTLTYNVAQVSDAPTGQSGAFTIDEDANLTSLTELSFGFSDAIDGDADSFAGVRIMSFSGNGQLTLDGMDVALLSVVDASDVARIVYQPDANENGAALATVGFRVIDSAAANNEDLVTRFLTIDVNALHDFPTGSSATLSILEDEVVSLTAASFGFSDAIDGDTDSFARVRIVDFVGTLQLNSIDVVPGAIIDEADIANLVYQPPANQSGAGIGSIDFRVIDSGAANNEDQITRQLTFDVTPVGDAPSGVTATMNATEDVVFGFTESTFGFEDMSDSIADNFSGVRIVSFSGRGSLTIDGVDVNPGQVVSALDLPRLQYLSDENDNGAAIAQIQFRVMDDGPTNNEDTITRTLTLNVVNVDDFPFGQSDTVSIPEDTVVSFTKDSFGYDATADGTAFGGVRIVSFSGSGSLTIDGVDVAAGSVVDASDLSRLRYQPGEHDNGLGLSTIEFRVRGASVNNNEDQVTRTLVYDVQAVSDAPVGESQTVEINEDEIVTFTASSFGFDDDLDNKLGVADSFTGVRITGFSGSGTLTVNGTDVVAGSIVDATDLADLRYRPSANDFGPGLSTISFRVIDSGVGANEDTVTRVLTYNVNPLNDAPEGVSNTVEINEDEILTFADSTFGFSDPNDSIADGFHGVRIIDFSGIGQLTIDGNNVVSGDFVDATDLSRLQYDPGSNVEGSSVATIDFRVVDDGGTGAGDVNEDTTTRTLTIDVAGVNDAPEGTSQTISIVEDSVFHFADSTFGFSDPLDIASDNFEAVRIVSFSGSGRLTLDGADVTAGAVVDAADIARLRFSPGQNQYGLGISSVDFRVIDDGAIGAANNNEDLITRTITFDVVPVSDMPVGVDFTIVMDEESVQPFLDSDFQIDDAADSPAEHALKAIRIVDWSGPGRMMIDGTLLAKNSIVNFADIGRLSLESDSVTVDSTGIVEFTVIDSGGDDNGGVVESTVNTIDFTVRQVNKAPVITASEIFNAENVILDQLISVFDEEGDNVTFSFAGSANDNSMFEFTSDGSSVRFVNAQDFESPQSIDGDNQYAIQIVATDSQGAASQIQTILVNVQNVVEQVELDDDLVVDDGSGVEDVSLFANDNDGIPMPLDATVTVVSQPSSGTVVINADGTFTYTPASIADSTGTVDFSYQVERGGEFSTADVEFVQAGLPGPLVNQTPGTSDPAGSGNLGESDDDVPADESVESTGNPVEGPIDQGADSGGTLRQRTQSRSVSNNGADTLNNDASFDLFESGLYGGVERVSESRYVYSNFVDTGLLTGEVVSRLVASGRAGIQEFTEDFVLAALFWEEMDSASHDYIEASIGEIETVIAVGAFGASVAVGIAMRWALIGISLGATYSQPLWVTTFDFLPVVRSDDNESIQQIVDGQS